MEKIDQCPKCKSELFCEKKNYVYCIAEECFFNLPMRAWMHYADARGW